MPSTPIPPLLTPYIRVRSVDTLVLSTYVLGALNNWLLLRYLHACLGKSASRNGFSDANDVQQEVEIEKQDDVAVVLVSWMRDFAFWKSEARKAVGLDLTRLQQQGRFAFVDGLSKLFDGAAASQSQSPAQPQPAAQAQAKPHVHLTDSSLRTLLSTIKTAISSLNDSVTRIILILDTPTLPLSIDPTISAGDFAATLLTLRALPKVSGCIVSVPVDEPFVASALHASQSAQGSGGTGAIGIGDVNRPLENVNSAVVAQLAAQARFVVGTRRLGTGWARDVSGVLRVTRGGAVDEFEVDLEGNGADGKNHVVKEGEWLYFVEGDGSVRVWGRGSGAG